MSNTKQIGLWTTTSLVVGNMIASGLFMLPATLAVYGGISLIGWRWNQFNRMAHFRRRSYMPGTGVQLVKQT